MGIFVIANISRGDESDFTFMQVINPPDEV